jgi:hypothetical protein
MGSTAAGCAEGVFWAILVGAGVDSAAAVRDFNLAARQADGRCSAAGADAGSAAGGTDTVAGELTCTG